MALVTPVLSQVVPSHLVPSPRPIGLGTHSAPAIPSGPVATLYKERGEDARAERPQTRIQRFRL